MRGDRDVRHPQRPPAPLRPEAGLRRGILNGQLGTIRGSTAMASGAGHARRGREVESTPAICLTGTSTTRTRSPLTARRGATVDHTFALGSEELYLEWARPLAPRDEARLYVPAGTSMWGATGRECPLPSSTVWSAARPQPRQGPRPRRRAGSRRVNPSPPSTRTCAPCSLTTRSRAGPRGARREAAGPAGEPGRPVRGRVSRAARSSLRRHF